MSTKPAYDRASHGSLSIPAVNDGASRAILVKIEIDREVKSLITYVKEYGDSLLRAEGEKELQKAIAERAEIDCKVKPAQFKKAATAYFKDKVKELREDLGEQLDLLELIQEG